MKKVLLLLVCVFAVLIAGPLAAQNSMEPLPDSVREAFEISFSAYFTSAMMASFGQPPAGVVQQEETLIFTNANFLELGLTETYGYVSMSGSIVGTEENGGMAASLEADLTLSGGAITSLSWEVSGFSQANMGAVFTITADGQRYHYSMVE